MSQPRGEAGFRVGVISDTHNFLDSRVLKLFAGVDHILHAGDIGLPRILHQLEQLAPVTAVMGNTDDPAFRYPHAEVVELNRLRFLIHHIVNPHYLTETVRRWMDRERPNVVVFGHTHKPFNETLEGVLFFNPGYAGKPRFGMPRSVAILHLLGGKIRPEFLPLPESEGAGLCP